MAEFSVRAVNFIPDGGLKGGKIETPMGAAVGLGVGAGGPVAFPAADTYMSGSSEMAAYVLV